MEYLCASGIEGEIFKLFAAMLSSLREELRAELQAEMQTKMHAGYQPPAARGLECPPVQVRYVLIPLFSLLTGYSEKAVRQKIVNGVWIQGRHYRKAPDGRVVMDLEAYARWVEGKG